jgi:hypothetical protein
MKLSRKRLIPLILAVPITIATAASVKRDDPSRQFTNLKVLPKDISPKDLNKIMVSDFEDALGVGCNFCHAAGKTEGELDYASDAKPEKNIAREMMRITLGTNKKFFHVKHPAIGSNALVVNCNTCHNGVAFPEGK